MVKVAFIIPAYNEEKAIGPVISNLKSGLNNKKYDYEIVVVDDGSKDKTSNISIKSGAKVIKHILNTGAGGATATGLSFAQQNSFDVAVTLDADGQHHTNDIIKGVELITKNKADLLIGSRLIDTHGMSRVKIFGNQGLSTITNMLFGVKVTDSQSGLRVFSRKALDTLQWKTSGYEFCSEMLWRAKQKNLIIQEYPIKAIYTNYSKGKGQNNWNGFGIVKSLFERRIMELFGE